MKHSLSVQGVLFRTGEDVYKRQLHEGCEYVPAVIAALGAVKTPLGTYAVLGNNDYEACYDDILKEMERQ